MKKPSKAEMMLAEKVTELMNSESFKATLKLRKHFHNYSLRNCWLIFLQCPEATRIAGFGTWKKLGRYVRKGEKHIGIIAPIIRKDDEGVERFVGVRGAVVFDISQTDGEPLPEMVEPELLTETSDDITRLTSTLEAHCNASGNPVSYQTLPHGVRGACTKQGEILIAAELPALQTFKTMVHEVAHAYAHLGDNRPEERHIRELEAESTAFLVLDALGLDSSRYTFAYLAHWADHIDEILPAAQRASETADRILEALSASQEVMPMPAEAAPTYQAAA